MTWHAGQYAKLSTKWYVWNDEQAMITDWLSRSVSIWWKLSFYTL